MFLLEHPQHGRMHVYSEGDVARHIALGWSVVKDEPPKEAPKAEEAPQRRRGRPPKGQ